MITLILVVCLTGSPDTCKEVTAPADLSLTQCMMYGQPIAAEMLRDMPKYELKGWRCQAAKRPERKA
jgi:hypothetical protein